MNVWHTPEPTFAEQLAERLFTLEPSLRTRVQDIERDPERRHRDMVQVSTFEARTILRVLLPACMALGRTRRATLKLQAALSSFTVALVGTTEPHLEDQALAASVALLSELQGWIDELRWRQATRRGKVAWRRAQSELAINAILRQSTAAESEHHGNTVPPPLAAGPAPKRRRKAAQLTGQRSLLLPIAGGGAAETPIAASAEPPAKVPEPKRKAA
jgi:hypothetical protein